MQEANIETKWKRMGKHKHTQETDGVDYFLCQVIVAIINFSSFALQINKIDAEEAHSFVYSSLENDTYTQLQIQSDETFGAACNYSSSKTSLPIVMQWICSGCYSQIISIEDSVLAL